MARWALHADDRVGRLTGILRNFEFFDAPHVAYVCMAKSFGIGVALDVGMYVQTLMLAMQSRGIASCAQAALRAFPELAAEHLGIPDDEQILCGLSFGYEDPGCRPTKRASRGTRSRATCSSEATPTSGP